MQWLAGWVKWKLFSVFFRSVSPLFNIFEHKRAVVEMPVNSFPIRISRFTIYHSPLTQHSAALQHALGIWNRILTKKGLAMFSSVTRYPAEQTGKLFVLYFTVFVTITDFKWKYKKTLLNGIGYGTLYVFIYLLSILIGLRDDNEWRKREKRKLTERSGAMGKKRILKII